MNLINALAVVDISAVMEEAEVECMLANIEDNNDAMNKLNYSMTKMFVDSIRYLFCGMWLPCVVPSFFKNKISYVESGVKDRIELLKINQMTGKLTLSKDLNLKRYKLLYCILLIISPLFNLKK